MKAFHFTMDLAIRAIIIVAKVAAFCVLAFCAMINAIVSSASK